MNQADLPAKEKSAAHIAGLFAILGQPAPDFAPVWNKASRESRRLFLQIAKLPFHLVDRGYEEMRPDTRIELKTRVCMLRDWLNKQVPA